MSQQRYTASTINDDALDALYARIKTLEAVAEGNKRHVQLIAPELERTEAAVARVHALAEQWEEAWSGQPHHGFAAALRAALAEPKE